MASAHVKPNKTVLVTGGARRIGRAIVKGLAEAGFSIAIHANASIEDARALASELGAGGTRAIALSADLRDEDAARDLIRRADVELGGLGVLINNASIFERDSLTDFKRELWDKHFDIHVRAPSILVSEFANLLPGEVKGLVVNVIDQRVWAPTPGFYTYTLSKAALYMATKTMAMSLAPRIRVNAIGPGPTLANERQSPEDFARQSGAVMLGKGPDLDEFTRTIMYFYETPSVTGQMIAIDGGQHLAWETPDVTGFAE
jgi:NAD(P)-dependent dehydrogenase (short-subunit alcohol dehydrogenase family)